MTVDELKTKHPLPARKIDEAMIPWAVISLFAAILFGLVAFVRGPETMLWGGEEIPVPYPNPMALLVFGISVLGVIICTLGIFFDTEPNPRILDMEVGDVSFIRQSAIKIWDKKLGKVALNLEATPKNIADHNWLRIERTDDGYYIRNHDGTCERWFGEPYEVVCVENHVERVRLLAEER